MIYNIILLVIQLIILLVFRIPLTNYFLNERQYFSLIMNTFNFIIIIFVPHFVFLISPLPYSLEILFCAISLETLTLLSKNSLSECRNLVRQILNKKTIEIFLELTSKKEMSENEKDSIMISLLEIKELVMNSSSLDILSSVNFKGLLEEWVITKYLELLPKGILND